MYTQCIQCIYDALMQCTNTWILRLLSLHSRRSDAMHSANIHVRIFHVHPIAHRVAQNFAIISKNFRFSTGRTRILMGFLIYYLVLIVNPMGRILVRWFFLVVILRFRATLSAIGCIHIHVYSQTVYSKQCIHDALMRCILRTYIYVYYMCIHSCIFIYVYTQTV